MSRANVVLVPNRVDRSARLGAQRRGSRCIAFVFIATLVLASIPVRPAGAAQATVGLGRADGFAVLSGAGITNTGASTITGDIGTFPTLSETGFGSIQLNGVDHGGDAVTQGAKTDLAAAFAEGLARSPATNVAGELGGATMVAGVYASSAFGIAGTLTLDAKGNPDAEFVFQAGSTVIAEANSRVVLLNGADPCHVTWLVGSSATFHTAARFVGDVVARASITAQTGATFLGRLLARDGAVTMDTNTITKASCVAPRAASQATPAPIVGASPAAASIPSGAAAGTAAPALGSNVLISPDAIGSGATGGTSAARVIPARGVSPTAVSGLAPGATGADSGLPRWTLRAPRTVQRAPSATPFLAAIGAPVKALTRAGLALIALGVVGSVVLFVARRRRTTSRS